MQQVNTSDNGKMSGAPGMIRTFNPRIRSPYMSRVVRCTCARFGPALSSAGEVSR